MNDVTKSIVLDWANSSRGIAKVRVKQGDSQARKLYINLYNNGVKYNPSSSTVVSISGTKPDHTTFYNTCTISGNVITATITEQMSAVAGTFSVDLVLIGNNERVSRSAFYLEVSSQATSDVTIISTDEYLTLVDAISGIGQYDSRIDYLETNKADTTALTSEATTRATNDTAISNRVENIIASSGDGTTPTMLTDMKTSSDGQTTYTSPQLRVSTEINELNETIIGSIEPKLLLGVYNINTTDKLITSDLVLFTHPNRGSSSQRNIRVDYSGLNQSAPIYLIYDYADYLTKAVSSPTTVNQLIVAVIYSEVTTLYYKNITVNGKKLYADSVLRERYVMICNGFINIKYSVNIVSLIINERITVIAENSFFFILPQTIALNDITGFDIHYPFVLFTSEGGTLSLKNTTKITENDLRTKYIIFKYYADAIVSLSPNFILENGLYPSNQRNLWRPTIYNKRFNELFSEWSTGNYQNKIMIMGDSTTDGVGTTGWTSENGNVAGTAYRCDLAYPSLMSDCIKTMTGITEDVVINGGFSGKDINYLVTNFTTIISPYTGIKMIGLSGGINDYALYETAEAYYSGIFSKLDGFAYNCRLNGITPFILTTQAVLQPKGPTTVTNPNYSGYARDQFCNKAKIDWANLHGYEVIDINKSTQQFMTYSSFAIGDIIADTVHFGDVGHKFEADYLLSEICPQIIKVGETSVVDFANQKVKSAVNANSIVKLSSPENGFKIYANVNKAEAVDLILMDAWIYNDTKKTVNITVYQKTLTAGIEVKVDDAVITFDSISTVVKSNLSMGLCHVLITSKSTELATNLYGIKIN